MIRSALLTSENWSRSTAPTTSERTLTKAVTNLDPLSGFPTGEPFDAPAVPGLRPG
jgi:hypothetical protein